LHSPTTILYVFFISPMCATCPTHHTLLDLSIITIFNGKVNGVDVFLRFHRLLSLVSSDSASIMKF
jgi:hypothetical protein